MNGTANEGEAIPIGGSGEVDYDKEEIQKNYNFEADLKTSGGSFATSVTDVEEFRKASHYARRWTI